jgi:hypothetical protein
MFHPSLKSLRLAAVATLILAASACSSISPAPNVAASNLAAQNAWAQSHN